jgi:DmsE family decaheme c-type cytochrome
MSIRPIALGGLALLLFFGLSPGLQAQEQAAESEFHCYDCHDQAKAFTTNPHARNELKDGNVPNHVCESCHDGGTAHMEAGGDKALITVPRGLDGAKNTCAACHDKAGVQRSPRMGVHANSAAVNCLTCHSIHNPADRMTLVSKPETELCASCHQEKASQMRNMPYTHRFGRGGLTCSTCHDPHARPGEQNLRRTRQGEPPCASCHTDKRGPFVFQHGGNEVGKCWSCHEVHGSTKPMMLRRPTVAQLCIECHSPINAKDFGSQPPSFHNLTDPRYQNCTTCHVAIHGSNRSPALLK